MNNPPHIDVTLSEALTIRWESCNILSHQQGFTGSRGLSDQLCKREQTISVTWQIHFNVQWTSKFYTLLLKWQHFLRYNTLFANHGFISQIKNTEFHLHRLIYYTWTEFISSLVLYSQHDLIMYIQNPEIQFSMQPQHRMKPKTLCDSNDISPSLLPEIN